MNENKNGNGVFTGLAAHDFNTAYKKGFFRSILNKLSGHDAGLLSFDEIRRSLKFRGETDRGLEEVEIEKIIGSLNRYQDFDDQFLPIQTHTRNRWQNIDKALLRGEYLPPVELYKIGGFYFVIDGNHRVSVARAKGQKYIDAHVIELELPFPLGEEFDWQEALQKQEKSEFLDKTHLDELRPGYDFDLSIPGQYQKLLEHIEVHRYYMSQNFGREYSYQEAVESWADRIYTPMIEVIRENRIMDEFPNRTETDLYLWIIEHLAYIQKKYPEGIDYREAASDFSRQKDSIFNKIVRFFRKQFQERK